PWGDDWDLGRGNFVWDEGLPGRPKTVGSMTPVNSYPGGVGPYGVWDMAGNLAEWTGTLHRDEEFRRIMKEHGYGEPDPNRVKIKGYFVRNVEHPELAWLQYILSNFDAGSYDEPVAWGTGFRPVRDIPPP